MKYSLIIQRAALTARLLGYRVHWHTLSDNRWYAEVRPPNGKGYTTRVLEPGYGTLPSTPTDTELLGHWINRLHMESQFGIKTSHYWE